MSDLVVMQGPRRPPSPKCNLCGHPKADHSPQHAPGFSPGICHDCTYESGNRQHEFVPTPVAKRNEK